MYGTAEAVPFPNLLESEFSAACEAMLSLPELLASSLISMQQIAGL
jgi:hypothetical protein